MKAELVQIIHSLSKHCSPWFYVRACVDSDTEGTPSLQGACGLGGTARGPQQASMRRGHEKGRLRGIQSPGGGVPTQGALVFSSEAEARRIRRD